MSLFSALGWSYGLSKDLGDIYAETRLVVTVYRFKNINYCVEIKDEPKISQQSMELQTELALKVWLEPLKALGIEDVTITKISCSSNELDLRVLIGKYGGNSKNNFFAYYDSTLDKTRYYSNIVLNTEFVDEIAGAGPQKIVNTQDLLGEKTLSKFQETLEELIKMQVSHQVAAAKFGVKPLQIYYSSFPILLHELGHAFGLCDTYKPKSDEFRKFIDCSPEYMNRNHPDSVMKQGLKFNLYDDDKAAITEIFNSFKGKIKPAYSVPKN